MLINHAKLLVFKAFQIDKLTDRQLLQKKIYLLQELIDIFNYHYIWEINGPYSIDLSDDYFDLLNEEVVLKELKLRQSIQNDITLINSLKNNKPNNLTNLLWYQLLSSLLFIYNNRTSWKVTNKAEIISTLLIYQKFTINQCYRAWNILTRYEFIKKD